MNHPFSKIKIILAMAILGVGMAGVLATVPHAFAGIADNVHGWLWSDMPNQSDHVINAANEFGGRGLGWISTNNMNPDGGGGSVSYGLSLNQSGQLSGTAWSEFGGWVSFNPTGPYPAGVNTAAVSARVNPACWANPGTTTCPVVGWARFLAGGSASSGGWDGWISLKGDLAGSPYNGYTVTYNKSTKQFSGDAWGDWVAGWINFDGARVIEAQVTDVCPDDAAYPGTIGTQTSLPAGYHFEQLLIYPHGGSPLQQQGQPANYTIETVCRPDTIPDVCTNLSGNQSSTPIQVAGVWYDDLDGDKVCSPMANPSDSIDLCPDNLNPNLPGTQSHLPYLNPADGKWYDDPNHDGRCTVALDICPIAPGNQTSNATNTWQVSGVWYGLSNNICVKDVCPDNSKYTPTSGFQAVVPTNYEIVAGVCQPKTIIDGNPGQGVPVDPIYKEN